MPVDNELYDRLADTWWDEEAWLHLLRISLNPARFGYLRDAVAEHGLKPSGARALDVTRCRWRHESDFDRAIGGKSQARGFLAPGGLLWLPLSAP